MTRPEASGLEVVGVDQDLRTVRRLLLFAVVVFCLGAAVIVLAGCAVGKAADGGAVVGLKAGLHPDADSQDFVVGGITAGATALFGPGGGAAAGALATAVIGALGWRSTARRAAEAEVKAAESEGRHAGWDERELAAKVIPVAGPGGGAES